MNFVENTFHKIEGVLEGPQDLWKLFSTYFVGPLDMSGSGIFDWGGPRIEKARDDRQKVADIL